MNPSLTPSELISNSVSNSTSGISRPPSITAIEQPPPRFGMDLSNLCFLVTKAETSSVSVTAPSSRETRLIRTLSPSGSSTSIDSEASNASLHTKSSIDESTFCPMHVDTMCRTSSSEAIGLAIEAISFMHMEYADLYESAIIVG